MLAPRKKSYDQPRQHIKKQRHYFANRGPSLKMKIMASRPITSWEIDRETVKQCQTLFLGGSKITVDGDCSHEIKRRLLLGRKVMTNL